MSTYLLAGKISTHTTSYTYDVFLIQQKNKCNGLQKNCKIQDASLSSDDYYSCYHNNSLSLFSLLQLHLINLFNGLLFTCFIFIRIGIMLLSSMCSQPQDIDR